MGIWTDIREFFFPRLCLSCGRKLQRTEEGLCLSCMAALPYTQLSNTPGNEMERYFWGRFPVGRASSLFFYARGGTVARILYAMKYHNRRQLCVEMGKRIADELAGSGFFGGVDFLIPVPLYKARLRQRGYNQSELLAKGISLKTHIPLCLHALCRVRNNATQTRKGAYARWQNVEGLFAPLPASAALRGKHVMLVDDVLTTGATLVACADALSAVEGIRISVVTLAWAK